MEDPVFARNFEAGRPPIPVRPESHETVNAVPGLERQVVESQHQFIPVAFHRLIYRCRGRQSLYPVIIREGK